MTDLRFEVPFDDASDFRADAVLGNSVFEVLIKPRDLRHLRASIVDIARYSGGARDRRGILVLNEPLISDVRLRDEWDSLQSVFHPDVLPKLAAVIHRKGSPDQILGKLDQREKESIPSIIKHALRDSSPASRRSRDAFYDILRILINQWLAGKGPLTSRSLCETAGCSYPTAASALKKLGKYLTRHSDRRVELRTFPRDAWSRLVANADQVRQTQWFVDHSGQTRSIDSLLARLQKIRPEGVAIGGVPGARRLDPSLDLVGIPRLDITIHCRVGKPDMSFLRQLDPALKPGNTGESARVVIHALHQEHVFFERDKDGVLWADPVECLLDLHEMRLETQASEFLKSQVLKLI